MTDELGEPTATRRGARASRHHPPPVRLGALIDGGLAPAIMAIVDRGVRHRPALAHRLNAEVELTFEDQHPPVRIVFGERLVLVEDGPAVAPDLRVDGSLPDQISLMVAPLLAGVPSPITTRGRAALGMVAGGRVRIDGRLALMRQFLRIIRI
ncbi:MAG TPA: hypothetical protein VMU39_18235 [Solirubrobacteraceae bacterium]|nr:hypothetical protein [Solirubrobacteraceae bacterium]